MFKILSPGQKLLIFRHFSPFFSYVAPAMRLQKRKNCQKISLFLPPAENFEQALILQHPFAKAVFAKAANNWKVYWIRGDLKWHSYTPKPAVRSLNEFASLVMEDEHHCFFG